MSLLSRRTVQIVVLKEWSTHLGSPVVPEVKAMRKTSSGSIRARSDAAIGGCVAMPWSRSQVPSTAPPATMMCSRPGTADLQLLRHGHVVEAFELLRAHEGAAFREAQDVVELALAEIGVHLVGDGADQLQREEHDRKLDPVRQLDRHHVAALDADLAQELGALLDAHLQLAIGDAAFGIGERLALRMGARPLLQNSEERLVGPQAPLEIALRELRIHHGLKAHG